MIPLHKVRTFPAYYEQFVKCVMLFISKKPELSVPLLEGLLKYWPFANRLKETIFLSELADILNFCDLDLI